MGPFSTGHAEHADWRVALARASAQLEATAQAAAATLGFAYITDHYAAHAVPLLGELQRRWPRVAWVGCTGVGVCASGVEYFDAPALALMLADLPPASFELFSGARPLERGRCFGALVHADPQTPELSELLAELADRTASGYLFGGLAASRGQALHWAGGVWQGGLSGVAFAAEVPLVSRVSQGCQPVGPVRTVTRCQDNVVEALDGDDALGALFADLGIADGGDHRAALPKLRATLVGLVNATDRVLDRGGQFGTDVRVRHLIGIDPARGAVALADRVEPGMRLTFCSRDVQAARRDLVRICSEIRDEVEGAVGLPLPAVAGAAGPAAPAGGIRGAVYVSCAGRGGPHFGGPSAELQIVRQALGDIPLVGFFAGGEIARHHLYGYTGVLTVFAGGR